MMSLQNLPNEKFPILVLHNICDFLNLSELKAFRLVCIQWHNIATLHIRNQAHMKLSTLKHEKLYVAICKISGEHFPVRNLKLSIRPRNIGCKCDDCRDSDSPDDFKSAKFDEADLHTIIRKCSAGIKSFDFKEMYLVDDLPQNHFRVNVEQLLLRAEFRILKQLCIHVPFEITPDSGIGSVFRNLTSLKLSYRCCEEFFTSFIFKKCCFLKSLAITLKPDEYFNHGNPFLGIVRILNAMKDAKNENEYLNIEELNISPSSWLLEAHFTKEKVAAILLKIRELNFKLKVLHLRIRYKWWNDAEAPERELMHEMWNLLESQKDTLVSLALPKLPDNSLIGLRVFPLMQNLKDLRTVVDLKFPLIQFQQKMPHLQSLIIECYSFKEIPQSIIPCETLKELQLDRPGNMELLCGLKRIFPNVRILKIDLQIRNLSTFWRIWPRLTVLDLTVIYFHRIRRYNTEEPVEIHSELIGMPVNECEALFESAIPFLSLKVENYNHNLPSIRDLSELRKLTLTCDFTCNIELMLGILPMKSLVEVSVIKGEMTIDCVQHLLRCSPNITRWEFLGFCSLDCRLDYYYTSRHFPKKLVKWTISSRTDMKHQPNYFHNVLNVLVYGGYEEKVDWYNIRLRSTQNFGRGRCLFWLPKTLHVPPSPYVFK